MQSRTARTIRMHDPKIKRDLNYVSGRRGASWHVNAGNYLAHDGHSLAAVGKSRHSRLAPPYACCAYAGPYLYPRAARRGGRGFPSRTANARK